jgi:23S rRNA (guanine745-N1)-methyltransferase
MQFHCPIDHSPLAPAGSALKCPSGHSFDRAKEGYYNLLLVQQKASLDPGDNKEMVEARRRFLEAGHFAPIAAKLVEISQCLVGSLARPHIFDAGCGEGYYLSRLQAALPQAELAGIDISKWAIKAAAKSHKAIAWAVASNRLLPFAEKSQDLLLCLFGFPFWESFRSVLADSGYLLLVDPAPDHLSELRELIYEKVKRTDLSSIEMAFAAGFSLAREDVLNFSITLGDQAAIQDLLAMTPHGYRITPEARARLAKQNCLTTKVSVAFRLLQKARA